MKDNFQDQKLAFLKAIANREDYVIIFANYYITPTTAKLSICLFVFYKKNILCKIHIDSHNRFFECFLLKNSIMFYDLYFDVTFDLGVVIFFYNNVILSERYNYDLKINVVDNFEILQLQSKLHTYFENSNRQSLCYQIRCTQKEKLL